MSATAEDTTIRVDDAIRIAFEHFDKFLPGATKNVLLEGVEIDEETDDWLITIGFDAGRERVLRDGSVLGSPMVASVARTSGETVEPVRELREFRLDPVAGALKKMRSLTL